MKLKRLAEDFIVEELPLVQGGDRGRFGFYRLSKRGHGTLEALTEVARRWNLASRRISYGGLKDRHASTVQYLTIADGPAQAIHAPGFDLEPIGRLDHPYGPAHFRGNRFAIVLRDLDDPASDRALAALKQLATDGLPNYFDDQRFGSVGHSGAFIAESWLKGDSARALWLALAEPTDSDRAAARAEKAVLRATWGRWAEAKAQLGRSHARSLVTYLVDHPTDFRGAFARIRRELRSLYFSAYQSHLWNLILARRIERSTRPEQRVAVDFKVASLPIPVGLDPEQAADLARADLPLPASRTTLPEGPDGEAALEVVASRGLAWSDLRVKHLKDVFFSKGVRPAIFQAAGLSFDVAADDLYPQRKKLRLAFELPKGSYATILVKRLTEGADAAPEWVEELG